MTRGKTLEPTMTQPATKQDLTHLKESIDRWRVQVQAKQDKHDHALFGNGEAGMDEQIRNLTSMMTILVKLAWLVAGSAVSITIAGIVSAVVYIIRQTATIP